MESALRIETAHPGEPEIAALLDELSSELSLITGRDGRDSFSSQDVASSRSAFVAAYLDPCAVGCGAIRPLSDTICEVKRMYARQRGIGVGRAILEELEKRAIEFGYAAIWLETGIQNQRALSFYSERGYRIRENFGKYRGRSECVCFEKILPVRLSMV